MASNSVTRDHHNLRRNLNLNDKYISNDGGDEGIRITDAGLVGIGVSDPDTALEVMVDGSPQLKLSKDDSDYLTFESTSATSEITSTGTIDINLPADGNFRIWEQTYNRLALLNSGSDTEFTLYPDSNDTGDTFTIKITDAGATTLTTVDDDGADAHLSVVADGNIILGCNPGGAITLQENDASTYTPTAASDATTKAYVYSIMYDHRVCNYNTLSSSLTYVPLAGYIIDATSTAGRNEYQSMVMPYNGTLERIIWRSEIEQTSGTFAFIMLISSDGTEIPATTNFRTRIASFTLAANTTYVHDPGVTQAYDATGNETNAFSKGQIIMFGVDANVAPQDTNCTLVFKYDTSS